MLVALIVGAYARAPCGDPSICYCFPDLVTVTCQGQNVTILRTFPKDVSTTVFLDAIATNITELPVLRHWSKLEWLTLTGNRYLSCNTHEKVPEKV